MRKHKHVFTNCDKCHICGKSLEEIENETNPYPRHHFKEVTDLGKPSERDWDRA